MQKLCQKEAEGKMMGKVKPKHYQTAYNKLYRFLKANYPKVLNDYRERLRKAKERADALVLLELEGRG